MRRLLLAMTCAAVPMLALGPGALAVSPSQEECEAKGGTFDKVQGTATCVEAVGNGKAESPPAQSVGTEGQGNLTNEKKVTCEGPGEGSSTAQCP